MGIPKFFGWATKHFSRESGVIRKLYQGDSINKFRINFDGYALDLNAIIHPITQRMYGYGKDVSEADKKKIRDAGVRENDVFYAICYEIENLRRVARPRKHFVIHIDGVAGVSKQAQQRSRRFRNKPEGVEDEKANVDQNKFDPNCISVGTEWMDRLSKYIYFYIQRQMKNNPHWMRLEVFFSNEKMPGEGEHKIMKHIRKTFIERPDVQGWCIHSPDADLIMLCLGLNLEDVYILRDNTFPNDPCKYFVIDVNNFRFEILKELKWDAINHEYTDFGAIKDFILIMFLLGNDFLPHIPCLEIKHGGIDILINSYSSIGEAYGHIVGTNSKGEYILNPIPFKILLNALASVEPDRLIEKSLDDNVITPCSLLRKHVVSKGIMTKTTTVPVVPVEEKKVVCWGDMTDDEPTEEEVIAVDVIAPTEEKIINFTGYRKDYYKKKLNIEIKHVGEIENVCFEYFKGLTFVLRYYLHEIPDWLWVYPLHYAPLFVDMARFSNCLERITFTKNKPLNQFEQLLCIMPPESYKLLPTSYQKLMIDPKSPLSSIYPSSFIIDVEGKQDDWQGTVLLPFVDPNMIQRVTKKIALSETDSKRNTIGKNIKYYYDEKGLPKISYYF